MSPKIRVGLITYGYWGPNYARALVDGVFIIPQHCFRDVLHLHQRDPREADSCAPQLLFLGITNERQA